MSHPESGYDQKKVVQSARNSFQKFVCHLPSTFPSLPCDSGAGLRERGSTLRHLGYGLQRALTLPGAGDSCLEGSASLVDTLQQHMLEFTKRLHMAEVERRDLRIEVRSRREGRESGGVEARHADRSKTKTWGVSGRYGSVCMLNILVRPSN